LGIIDKIKAARHAYKNETAYQQWLREFMSGEEVSNLPPHYHADGEVAMKYSAVFSCVKVLAETFASSPIMLYRNTGEGRERVNNLRVYDILHNRPNEEMSPFSFKETLETSRNLGGNAICERLVNGRGDLVGLYPYPWSAVSIQRNAEGRLEYVIGDGEESKVLSRDQVLHIPGLSFDGVIGLSPIEYVSNAIRLGLSYESFAIQLYKNGATSTGAFKHPSALKEEAYKRLKKELKENYTGLQNSGTPMLLEDGLEFVPFSIKPVDAQMLESKRFQIEDIARIYRVPLHLLQDLTRATNNNIEHQSLEFVMYTMLPIYKRAEEAMNAQLLTRQQRQAGYYLEFKMDGLLRGDIQSRYAAYAIARQWGIMSINDIRKLENMNPIDGGDSYLQPLNMISVEKADEYYQTEVTDKQVKEIKSLLERG